MSSRPPIIINRLDAERLQRLIDQASDKDRFVADCLEEELERGEVIDPEEIPTDVVSMNSQVQFTDLTRNRQMIRTLVYPHALASTEDGISVMAPIGAGLIGLRIGDEIDWPLPDGSKTRLRIDAILWQPEREGQFHR
ncbi:nucleoside diphosphate kinase regulator [Billgrantia tianxiuensis]|jgi:regulator of nucleoside diphosphate kinase|uniref:Nucleoside diphosphate kinase regulator n=1 Tax=Billgrantia tianxiuensis TaxID=2497861 RepID=A0A6I6SL84_9GAMM|nr:MULTISPECIES: nucleoside diphosphate kinase regulator [Halomonas]MCE8033806.1 nucleoside diphosphate kinase regulator [Halomonas sp. MCCC 1A11057]QHC51369.1 nucleoside diphosphate kinase regulator [Halomonas tianxiuensis]